MRVAIASGKGGTGKTTLATNLAVVGADLGRRVAYLDCDVEEPNGHLFLRPVLAERTPVHMPVPQVREDACDECGECAQVCMFSALVWLGHRPLVFPELCHGCGACVRACPRQALVERPRAVGVVEAGSADAVRFVHGRLNVGEAKSPPVIRAVRAAAPGVDWQIIDAPAGTSCPVVAAVRGADLVILVTEPTPFGLHDLELAVATLRQLGLPLAVVINRADAGDDRVERYCAAEALPVLLRIPDEPRVAEAYARGELLVTAVPELRTAMAELWAEVAPRAARGVRGSAAPDGGARIRRGAGTKELVIISGKGGTGKTSIAAALAVLAGRSVVADCDVDAADLHLVLAPRIQRREVFRSGHAARIRAADCAACGTCAGLCRFDAIRRQEQPAGGVVYAVEPGACEGCGVCVRHCPCSAIDFPERECGEWFISQTRCGPLVHARLFPAAGNSGKLVSLVREQARAAARDSGRDLVLIDGAPGIGCPVIASLTGASLALVVTEPTVSGRHDLERVAQLTAHFRVPTLVCVNKWDLNPEMTERIAGLARERGLALAGRVRYDPAVTRAQLAARSVVEYAADGAASDIRAVWRGLEEHLRAAGRPPAGPAASPRSSPNLEPGVSRSAPPAQQEQSTRRSQT